MAKNTRALDGLMAAECVNQLQQLRLDMAKLKAGTVFHVDASAAVATANATDLPTLITLINALKASYNTSRASACSASTGQGAHLAADATNVEATVDASDLATSITLANDLKAKFNAHLTQAGVHMTNDATNTIATANGTVLGDTITLANAFKTALNAHYAAAFTHQAIALVGP